MKIDIGLTEAERKEISDGLACLLADTMRKYFLSLPDIASGVIFTAFSPAQLL